MNTKADMAGQRRDEGGFSLVELLVAVLILVFVSIALLQTATVNIEFNARNALRDEGSRVAGELIDEMRNAPFANLTAIYNGVSGTTPPRRVRNMSRTYSYTQNASSISGGTLRLETTVTWDWKGESFSTTVSTVRSKY